MKTDHQGNEWPFEDPKNVAVFTTKDVFELGKPILYVYHDVEGEWQFHSSPAPVEEDAILVGLYEIVRLDPTINELASLPIGWAAARDHIGNPWYRSRYQS